MNIPRFGGYFGFTLELLSTEHILYALHIEPYLHDILDGKLAQFAPIGNK